MRSSPPGPRLEKWGDSHYPPTPTHFHPFLPWGWTVSPRLQATARREAGRHFLKSPRGGGGGRGGGARGRGQDWAGESDGVGTRWKIGPGAAQQFSKSRLAAARLRLRAGVRGAQGSPGCCLPGLPRTCPAPPAGRPCGSISCDSGGSGTRAPPTPTYDFGVPQPERNGRPGWGSPGHGVTGRSALLGTPPTPLQPPVVSVPSRM